MIAYLVNQYPKISHAFIRREIAALEARGESVARFSIRTCPDDLVDARDRDELKRTRVLCDQPIGMLLDFLIAMITRPLRFITAMRLVIRLGRRSERGVLVHLAYLAEAARLRKWMVQQDCRHLHAHFGTNPATIALFCRTLGGPPYSFTVHGSEELDRLVTLGVPEKVGAAKFVACVSDFNRKQIARYAKTDDWSKLHVVRCGLDREYTQYTPSPVPDVPHLLVVGRLSVEKGHLVLLDAMSRVVTQHPRARLTLIGEGPTRAEIEAKINELQLQQHVELKGWADQQQIRETLQASRALVLPSFMEGLPVVLMEAFAMGRPVIASAVSGIPELVCPGATGWLTTVGSVDALATALDDVLRQPVDRLTDMGRRGAALVQEQFNADIEAGKLANLIGGLNQPRTNTQPTAAGAPLATGAKA